jgi:hypothetical protein
MKLNLRTGLSVLTGCLLLAPQTFAASSFSEVRNILQDRAVNPANAEEQAELNVYRAGQLPHYEVTASSFIENGIDVLLNAAVRTTTKTDDFYPRLKKLVHPNGICFTGEWNILTNTPYTGYFAAGKKGLFVGRASVAMNKTEAGSRRGFGFAGKIFPTNDPSKKVSTANFFSVDELMGTSRRHFMDTATTNEPPTGFDISMIWLGLKIASAFSHADGSPNFRPLYPIARLGEADPKAARWPHWIRIQPEAGSKIVDEADFRNELDIQKNHPQGIRLIIMVSESTKDTSTNEGWQSIGAIELKESFVSYGCDRQLHFAHPKLDPSASL